VWNGFKAHKPNRSPLRLKCTPCTPCTPAVHRCCQIVFDRKLYSNRCVTSTNRAVSTYERRRSSIGAYYVCIIVHGADVVNMYLEIIQLLRVTWIIFVLCYEGERNGTNIHRQRTCFNIICIHLAGHYNVCTCAMCTIPRVLRPRYVRR
jgi:hypothetical protein